MTRVILALLIAASGLYAQPSRTFFPWWDMPIARDLNLRDDQQRQIRDITREYRSKLIDLRAQVEKAEGELQDLFDDENFDAQRAMQASERLSAARSELTRIFSTMNVRLRGVLTAEQWRELQRRQPRPGMRGPGGPAPGSGEAPRMRHPGPPRDRHEDHDGD